MLHVTLGTVYVTAGAWPALQVMYWDLIAYVTLHAVIRIITVLPVSAAMDVV